MSDQVTRRQFIKGLTVAAGSTVLAACAPKVVTETVVVEKPVQEKIVVEKVVTATPEPVSKAAVTGNVTIMHLRHELTEEQEAQFEADNPGVTIELIVEDRTRFFAMYAAGAPPDIFRCGYADVPEFLARGMLLDLTPYFETSEVMGYPDNLAPACSQYMAQDSLHVGSGPIYGMPKDWSPDSTIFVYKPAFENAGLDLPAEVDPMTYAEVRTAAEKVAVFEGDRTMMFGWTTLGIPDQIVESALAVGKDVYKDSYTAANVQDEDVKEIIKWWVDIQADLLMDSVLNPAPSGWLGSDFINGVLAMVQYGYWYVGWMGGQEPLIDVESEVMMITAPTWPGGVHIDSPVATGAIVTSATKVPDAAWKVFEWYHGMEPAIDRAKSGWGVPALKSLYELLPQGTEYEKQVYRVLQNELALDTLAIQTNPFAPRALNSAWGQFSPQALQGEITFDEMIDSMEQAMNVAIQEGIQRLS
jgi:multiple sugar transport system substrate-binding protein